MSRKHVLLRRTNIKKEGCHQFILCLQLYYLGLLIETTIEGIKIECAFDVIRDCIITTVQKNVINKTGQLFGTHLKAPNSDKHLNASIEGVMV